jgi:hypothetical protein
VPSASKSEAKTEATYRFLNNPSITYVPLVEAHVQQTCERVNEASEAIVAHDTTEFAYAGEAMRSGLARLRKGEQGFLAHAAVAFTADGSRRPLGVLGFSPWVRGGPARRRKANGKKKSGSDYAKEAEKESARWGEMVDEIGRRVSASLIHVMDREADAYPLLNQLVEGQHRFVVRMSKDRVIQAGDEDGSTELLSEALERVEGVCDVEVPVSRRPKSKIPGKAKTFPAREARLAKLRFSSTRLRLKKPRYETGLPRWLELNVVHVQEVDAPKGAIEIAWTLYTTEPIATEKDIMAIVEYYRTRWLIEEFFKALKTGCAVEKRQHESLHALLNSIAICLPIAWKLLLLRNLGRSSPDAPATEVLTPVQVEVLRICAPTKLAEKPTVREALYAVAALGGYLKSKNEPGWQVLGRGMDYLLTVEIGWVAARQKK